MIKIMPMGARLLSLLSKTKISSKAKKVAKFFLLLNFIKI